MRTCQGWWHSQADAVHPCGLILAAHLGSSLLQSSIKLCGVADKRACVSGAMQQQHRGQRLSPLYTLHAAAQRALIQKQGYHSACNVWAPTTVVRQVGTRLSLLHVY